MALLCTLAVDRPLQFLYGSWFLGPRRSFAPSLEELLPGGGVAGGKLIVAAVALFILAKALDYMGQISLIFLTAGAFGAEEGGALEGLRRGFVEFLRYAAAMVPLDLMRYFLLVMPFFVWLIWSRLDPDLNGWCAYLLTVFSCTTLSSLLYVVTGVFTELAGRALALGGESVPGAWASAWRCMRRFSREVVSAWLPTLLADMAAAASILAAGFTVSYLSMIISGGAGWPGLFLISLMAVKFVQALVRSYKSCVWTGAWLAPEVGGKAGAVKVAGGSEDPGQAARGGEVLQLK